MGIKWEYCMDGDGYGFPAAIIHPSHEDSFLYYNLEPEENEGTEIDFDNVLKDILFWSFATVIAYSSGKYFSRALKKRQGKPPDAQG